MKVSIVMATYNGERFIEKQLQSLFEQTRQPDEVLIQDDASSDHTVAIIDSFIQKNNINNWHISTNKKNMGYAKNFIDIALQATGDIIFFCDQDDVWFNDKIEVMSEAMESNDKILALWGGAVIIDEHGNEIKNLYFYNGDLYKYNGAIIKVPETHRMMSVNKCGCLMAIKRDIVFKLSEQSRITPSKSHDILSFIITWTLDGAYVLSRNVVYYRVHSRNASISESILSIIPGQSDVQKRLDFIHTYRVAQEEMLVYIANNEVRNSPSKIVLTNKLLLFFKNRENFLRSGNVKLLAKLVLSFKYYIRKVEFFADICYAYKWNKFAGKLYYKIKRKAAV